MSTLPDILDSSSDAARAVRYRLDVKRPGGPFLPESFHPTFEEAYDAGLLAVTGQTEDVPEPWPGYDFIIRNPGSR